MHPAAPGINAVTLRRSEEMGKHLFERGLARDVAVERSIMIHVRNGVPVEGSNGDGPDWGA